MVKVRLGLKTLEAGVKKRCLICDSKIEGHFVSVKTARDEYYSHLSCMVTGIVMLVNGAVLLVSWFKRKDD